MESKLEAVMALAALLQVYIMYLILCANYKYHYVIYD